MLTVRVVGDKPFKCSVCGRRFAEKSRYKKHKASACDKKKYQCSTCGVYYSSMQAVAFHEVRTGAKSPRN